MPAMRNLAGSGWASWASAITLPGLLEAALPAEAVAELDAGIVALSRAYGCAAKLAAGEARTPPRCEMRDAPEMRPRSWSGSLREGRAEPAEGRASR